MDIINPFKHPIFDAHAHYDDDVFSDDIGALMLKMKDQGVVGIINCGVNYASSKNSNMLCDSFPIFYSAVGVHPCDLYENQTLDRDIMSSLVAHPKVVAIGEIGLDYHWNTFPREVQIKWFEDQINFANEMGLPIIVHDREAHNDTLEILKQTQPRGVLHCFSGSDQMAKEILKLGMYIGIGGVVTFKNAKKTVEVVKMLPLDRLLLETDAPYLSPEPFRGKRCSSELIYFTAEKIAEIKGITAEEVLNASLSNAKTLFAIDL